MIKTVLITGASRGICAAAAKLFAANGYTVIINYLNSAEKALELAEETGGYAIKADVSDIVQTENMINEIIEKFGKIDVLINCAGVNKREGFLDMTEEDYDRMMDIDLKSLYFLSQETAKHMKEAHNGSIINVASHNSVGMLGGCSVYGAAKSAVVALTRSMAVEWSQYGIRANAVAPGHILTPLTQVNWDTPSRNRWLTERIAMERPGKPEELVGVMVLLASDASSYMSGMMIHVDGGCLAGGTPWYYHTEYDSKY